jgi:hypothetical protein
VVSVSVRVRVEVRFRVMVGLLLKQNFRGVGEYKKRT